MRVIVADDHYLLREGPRALLTDTGEVDICAAVATAPQLLEAVDRALPVSLLSRCARR